MSNSEALASQSAFSDLIDSLNGLSSTGFRYERRDGTVEYAENAQEVLRLCPVAQAYAQEAPDQLHTMFEMAAEAQALMDIEKKSDLHEPEPPLQPKKTKKSEKRDDTHDNKQPIEKDLHGSDDLDYHGELTIDDAGEGLDGKQWVNELPQEVRDEDNATFEAEIAEPQHTLELDDLEIETEELADFLVQPALEQIWEVAVVGSTIPEEVEENVTNYVIEIPKPIATHQDPVVVSIRSDEKEEENFSPEDITTTVIHYEDEPSIAVLKRTTKTISDSLSEELVTHYENVTPVTVESSKDLLMAAAAVGAVNIESHFVATINHDEVTVTTSDVVTKENGQDNAEPRDLNSDDSKLPQTLFYQESNQFDFVTRPKIESKSLVNTDVDTTPILLRDLNFQPLEVGRLQPEKIPTFDDIKHEVEGKSFEHSVVEVVKFMSIEKDSPEQQQLHEIVSEIRKSLSNAEINSDTAKPERSVTSEIYENTLTMLRFLGHGEPEEMLTKFTETHGEDFLLDTLYYISSLNEQDENKELYADADTIATYIRLRELTSEKPTLEPDFDSEGAQVLETLLKGLVLIQLQLGTEVPLDENQSLAEKEELFIPDSLFELTADTSVLLALNERQDEEPNYELGETTEIVESAEALIIDMDPAQLHCDEEVKIAEEKIVDSETFNLNPEDVVPLPMSLEFIQENAEEQPLEQTLAQVALHIPEGELTQNEELKKVVADIRELLTDNYLVDRTDNNQNEDELPKDLRRKTLELVKLFGYSKPEEAIEKCINGYGTDFLLKALSYICEPDDAFKRKTLELSFFTAGNSRKHKPSMEVAVFGMTSMYVYVPGI